MVWHDLCMEIHAASRLAVQIRGPVMGNRASEHACLRQGFKGHEVEQKYGDIPIRIFRMIYGAGFAPAFCSSHGLRHTLAILDRTSLDKLLADEKSGALEGKIARALEQEATCTHEPASGQILRGPA
jgi:hypothetical protein